MILAILFLIYDRSIFRIRLRHLPLFLAMGLVSILLFTLCYFRGQQVSSLAVAAILLYTAPTFVVILSAILWKDKITKREALALVLAFLGCCFVAGILNGQLTLTTDGLLAGHQRRPVLQLLHHLRTVRFEALPALYRHLLHLPHRRDWVPVYDQRRGACTPPSTPPGILLSLGLMVCGTVLPYILYTKGLNDLGTAARPPSWPRWSRWWPPWWASWPLGSP